MKFPTILKMTFSSLGICLVAKNFVFQSSYEAGSDSFWMLFQYFSEEQELGAVYSTVFVVVVLISLYFNISYDGSLLAMNSLSFCLLKGYFNFCFEKCYNWLKNSRLVMLFLLLKVTFHSLLPYIVSNKKSVVFLSLPLS